MRLLVSIIFLSLVSCASPKNNLKIDGKYKPDRVGVFGELYFLKKHRFDYRYSAGLVNTKSKGIWKIVDNHLILTSDPEYKTNLIEVTEITDKKGKFTIKHQDGTPVPYAHVILNKDTTNVYTIDENGEISFPSSTIPLSFELYHLGGSYQYKVKKGRSFSIVLYFDDLSKTYFNQRQFKIKKGKLFDPANNWKYLKTSN